jgi:hypothetical protein
LPRQPSFQRFKIDEIVHSFPEKAETLLLDTYLTNEEAASARVFRVYRETPPHYHVGSDEYLYVLSGRGTFWMGDASNGAEFGPGDLLFFNEMPPSPAKETRRQAETSPLNRSVFLYMHDKFHRRVARAAKVPAPSAKVAYFVGDKCNFHRLALAYLLLHLQIGDHQFMSHIIGNEAELNGLSLLDGDLGGDKGEALRVYFDGLSGILRIR